MHKFLFTAVLAAAGFISLNAQILATPDDYESISFVTSNVTSNGQPVILGFNEGSKVSIFDGDFNLLKQINLQLPTRISRSYSEEATIEYSGVKISLYNTSPISYNGEEMTATNLDDMLQKLSSWYEQATGYQVTFSSFTDEKANVSCYPSSGISFHKESKYGKAYPEQYFSLIDGMVRSVYVEYRDTIAQADIDNANWQIVSGSESSNTYIDRPVYFEGYDFDNNKDIKGTVLSQTIFNDDDKWEYVVLKYGKVIKKVGDVQKQGESSDGVLYCRSISESQEVIGLAIYNEDGVEIAAIPELPAAMEFEVYILGGNMYFYQWSSRILYKYDRINTSVQEVFRSSTKSSNISVNGRTIMVDDENQNIDEVVLFDMGGRQMVSARGKNRIRINASQMPNGVYSVATKKDGKINGAQKILLK